MIRRYFLLLSFSLLALGCERIKDSPAPDPIKSITLPAKLTIENSRNAEIDILGGQIPSGELTITIIRQPNNGSIVLNLQKLTFLYQANPGWFGQDSATYQVCSNQSCQTGVLYFILPDTTTPPCQPIAPDLVFSVNPGIDSLVFPGFSPCSAAVGQLLQNTVPDNIKLLNGRILTEFPAFTNSEFNLRYTICSPLGLCDTGNVIIKVRPDSNYCQARFIPMVDSVSILSNWVRRSILYDTLFANDPITCPNDLIKESLAIVSGPSRGTASLRSNPQGRFIQYAKNASFTMGQDSMVYSISSRSGKTALVKLFIKIKN